MLAGAVVLFAGYQNNVQRIRWLLLVCSIGGLAEHRFHINTRTCGKAFAPQMHPPQVGEKSAGLKTKSRATAPVRQLRGRCVPARECRCNARRRRAVLDFSALLRLVVMNITTMTFVAPNLASGKARGG